MYVTDNLMAHVSWKQAWDLWLTSVNKDEDDFVMSSMEANSNRGQVYFTKISVWLSEDEYASMESDNA